MGSEDKQQKGTSALRMSTNRDKSNADAVHPRYDAALERSGREFAELLVTLAECNQSLARLIRARVAANVD